MIIVLSILLALHLLVLIVFALWVHFAKDEKRKPAAALPQVSILLAARNEEHTILPCLESLTALNYPKDKYEVWIGNDQSEDNTQAVVEAFIADRPNFHLVTIEGQLGHAKGKANVLAQLGRLGKGEYFFITDADMRLQPEWIPNMLAYLKDDTAMVSGTTIVKGSTFTEKMQQLEWKYLMGFFYTMDHIHTIAAMGNNMAFRADVYRQTGGYEHIPFSVVEDYQLMIEFDKIGYRHKHALDAGCLAWTLPTDDFVSLLKQRKRWAAGGKHQPLHIWLLILTYTLFFPLLVVLFIFSAKTALYFLLLHAIVDTAFFMALSARLRIKCEYAYIPFFELYLPVMNLLAFLYSFMPGGIVWKGRRY